MIDIVVIAPTLVIFLVSAWGGLWEGAAWSGAGVALLVALRWYVDRPRKPERVHFDATGIVSTMPDGRKQSIHWSDVSRITVVTTDAGPAVEDVYWEFSSADREIRLVIANGAEGMKELLAHIQRLPGFDNRRLVEAMGCTTYKEFLVWQKHGSAA
jgi:hypothetical protein